MKIAPIIQQLDGNVFAQISGAREFAGLRDVPTRLPAAFVVPEGWSASASRLAGAVDQALANTFTVVVLLGASRDGEDDLLETLERSVIESLVGWRHPDASGPIQLAGARLLFADSGALAWAISFKAPSHFRKVQ